jgi:SAM-dependent methyltransferase
MTEDRGIGRSSAVMPTTDRRSPGTALLLPHPDDHSRPVRWTGEAFDVDGTPVRVLAFPVTQSGWTEKLTQLHECEAGSNHFIDVASRADAADEVARLAGQKPAVIVEIGCSSGFLLRELAARLPGHVLVGADYTLEALEKLGRHLSGVPLLQFDLTRCPLPDGFADIVVLLNVLEHIEDDARAMTELFRIVRPGGAVVIQVPAGAALFDVYDRVLMHHRRYDMSVLLAGLRRAGFVVERRSHLGFLLYPAFYLSKRLNQLRYPAGSAFDEEAVVSRMIAATRKSSRLLGAVMTCERVMDRYTSLPFGIRCLATCRKPLVPDAGGLASPPADGSTNGGSTERRSKT